MADDGVSNPQPSSDTILGLQSDCRTVTAVVADTMGQYMMDFC